jgi:hypothetical protein
MSPAKKILAEAGSGPVVTSGFGKLGAMFIMELQVFRLETQSCQPE